MKPGDLRVWLDDIDPMYDLTNRTFIYLGEVTPTSSEVLMEGKVSRWTTEWIRINSGPVPGVESCGMMLI